MNEPLLQVIHKNEECMDMQSGRNTGTLSHHPGLKLGKLKSRLQLPVESAHEYQRKQERQQKEE